jgi:hypothetical protein
MVRGRPKKVADATEEIETITNPDLKPASRGYVKCKIRETADHNHRQDAKYGFTLWSAIAFSVVCLFLASPSFQRENPSINFGMWIPMIALSALVLFIVSVDLYRFGDECTYYTHRLDKVLKHVRDWEPEPEKKPCSDKSDAYDVDPVYFKNLITK